MGAVRSTITVRITSTGATNPALLALTVSPTLGSVRYDAAGGTGTDHVPSAPEVTVRVPLPSLTVTATPGSLPVSPVIGNPAAFSAMLTTSSPAIIVATFRTMSSLVFVTVTAFTVRPL